MSFYDQKLYGPLVILTMLLASCHKDDKETTDTGGKIKETPADLRGTWLSPCLASDTLGLQKVQREYIFNSIGDFDKLERYYTDADCKTIGATYKTIGTVDAKGPLTQDTSIQSMNLTVNDARLTVHSPGMVEKFNALKLCGHSDWAAEKEVSVASLDCGGVQVKQGDVIFDVYSRRDAVLYFGDSSLFLVKSSGDQRPTSINLEAPYSKK